MNYGTLNYCIMGKKYGTIDKNYGTIETIMMLHQKLWNSDLHFKK